MRAYGKLLELVQAAGPFPAGLVLHSWAGPPEMVGPLAKIPGVHFSLSGHLTRLPLAKACDTVQKVRRNLKHFHSKVLARRQALEHMQWSAAHAGSAKPRAVFGFYFVEQAHVLVTSWEPDSLLSRSLSALALLVQC